MTQYIDKSALVAEIDKWKEDARKGLSDYAEGVYDTYEKILLFLDTLEVKDMNIEKSISDWLFEGLPNDEELIDYIKETAKHFFELGLNTKGKKL